MGTCLPRGHSCHRGRTGCSPWSWAGLEVEVAELGGAEGALVQRWILKHNKHAVRVMKLHPYLPTDSWSPSRQLQTESLMFNNSHLIDVDISACCYSP